VEALIEEIRKFRASHFKEKQRRRHARVAEELEQAQPYLEEQAKLSDRGSFEERLRPLLRPMYSLAVAEVESRQTAGELNSGAVDPVEVVDEIVARAYEAFRDGSVTFPLKTWLVARMTDYLDEVSASDQANPVVNADVHLEERFEKQEPWDAGSPGDDKLDFDYLDESLHLEDVFPDLALTNPEEVLSAREQMRFVHQILRDLPRLKRQSFLLHADGFDDVEIAMVQHRPEHEIRRNIEEVRQMILKQLGLEA
jgi:DNA-directed RNA polymerase specialized sigma24 family protein